MSYIRHKYSNSYRLGLRAESVAAWFLRLKGYRVLERRYRTSVGEIDIIVRRKNTIVFVEVKASRTNKQEIYMSGLGNKGGYAGGGVFDKGISEMVRNGLIRKDKSHLYANLKKRIKDECENFGITDKEVNQVYDHILDEMLQNA
ncbi:MAG: YraN family protein [Bacteroidetes bacterium]|nr:YraN family protein [Bacteroidota bacterium]